MSFKQTGNIHDYIFPLIKTKRNPNNEGFKYNELIGTGFLIGSQGYAITAGHVIDQLLDGYCEETDGINAMFQSESQWYGYEIEKYEKHPNEDVGLVKLKTTQKWESIIKLTKEPQNSSCEYDCWGFPHEIAKELQLLEENAGERPELIYTQGYVRRRISRDLYPIMIYKGKQFYELSEIVGGGNSGGPLILKKSRGQSQWDVFGIYIGENEKVGYGVRAEAFCDWIPKILGKTIIEEANNAT